MVRWLIEIIPAIRRKRIINNVVFLNLIQEYKPIIVKHYDEYARQFSRWETENRYRGNGSDEALRLEELARTEVERLTKELQTKLLENGWCYHNLAQFNKLVHGCEGYVCVDTAHAYWNEIESFIVTQTN